MDYQDASDLLFSKSDCKWIVSHIKRQEQELQLKRRWLLDSSLAESKHDAQGINDFLNSKCLPESLLREDDIFYETVKSHVEEALGIWENEEVNVVPQNESRVVAHQVLRRLRMNLDALTNKGLYLIVMIITGGSVPFEKTRPKMKETIKDLITKDFRKMLDSEKTNVLKQLHTVLSDPGNFRKTSMTGLFPTFQSHRDAAIKVLNNLEILSVQTLMAMKRKLEGSRITPQLKPKEKSYPNQRHLIKQVRQASEKMLLELSGEDKLQEPLAKALELVRLALKLNPEHKSFAAVDFFQFTPETTNLQNEILKAICLLQKKVRFPELKKMQLLLGPEASISKDSLRSAIRRLLIDYLFECCDLNPVPDSLLKALAMVNRSSRSLEHKVLPVEAVEEEVECILNVSAQVKEVVLEWFPNYEPDQDFNDAYMEKLEDSDDEDYKFYDSDEPVSGGNNKCPKLEGRDTRDDASGSFDSDYEESCAECSVSDLIASKSVSNQRFSYSAADSSVIRDLTESQTRVHPSSLNVTPMSSEIRLLNTRHNLDISKGKIKIEPDEAEVDIGMESENQFSSPSLFSIQSTKIDRDEHKPPGEQNRYLAIQEVSDETGMVAYDLIGHLLEKFADKKCLELDGKDRLYLGGDSSYRGNKDAEEKSHESVIVGAVIELMPSLDKSVLKRLEELLDGS